MALGVDPRRRSRDPASVIGEAVDRIYAFETANWTAQTIAQDIVNVAIAYPAMIILAALALRGSLRAYLAWLGTLVFSVYSSLAAGLG